MVKVSQLWCAHATSSRVILSQVLGACSVCFVADHHLSWAGPVQGAGGGGHG